MAVNGETPLFKEVEIQVKVKKVPICTGCKLERAECPDCKMGYLEVTKKGLVCEFKEIEEVIDESNPGAGCPKSSVMNQLYMSNQYGYQGAQH